MTAALDDALLGWLVASVGGGLARWLSGDSPRAAMRTVVDEAVMATVAEVAGHLDGDQAEHLRCSLLLRQTDLADDVRVSNKAEMRDAIHEWSALLDHPEFGDDGYLAGIGVDPRQLGDVLAARIVEGVWRNGRSGGALNPLAEWLWRDELAASVEVIRRDLSELRCMVEPPRLLGGGLPGVTTEFTGRAEALAELAHRIEAHNPDDIVVVITALDGMAGVGKTQLALRAAHEHKHRYPDGHYFINLHGYTDGVAPVAPETALEELLRQAGMTGQQIPPDLAGRQARWHALMAGKRALVLLDNALEVNQVRPLLPMSAGCLVLVTSRSRLPGLPSAKSLSLDVLPINDAVTLFTRLTGADRQADQDAVARVVELVGRLPVAIEAAAGEVHDDLTVVELADDLVEARRERRLVDTTSLLGAGVWAAFDTSLRRLNETHRRAFLALGIYPGPGIGVPQFAALAGLSVTRARSSLRALAERNLIKPTPERIGHPRYELHDLMREFARQRAESQISGARRVEAIERLAAWYTAAISAVERQRHTVGSGPPEYEVSGLDLDGPGSAHAWLAAEQRNLVAFADVASGVQAAHVCYQAAVNLRLFSYHATAQTLHRKAADLYQRSGDRDGEAHARRGLGHVVLFTGDHVTAREHFLAARIIHEQIGNRAGQAAAQLGLGEVACAAGDYVTGGEHYRVGYAILEQIGDQNGAAGALIGLGEVAYIAGNYLNAARHYRAAQTIVERTGNQNGIAGSRSALGGVALASGNYHAAAEHYRAAWDIYEQIGNQSGSAGTRWSLGEVALATGDYRSAAEHYRAAQMINDQIGNQGGVAAAESGLGEVALATGDCIAAAEHYKTAYAIARTGSPALEAMVRNGLGKLAFAIGDYAAAAEHYRAAHTTFAQRGFAAREAAARFGLGQVALATGDHDAAAEHYRAAHTTFARIGARSGEADALWGLGHLANAQGNHIRAHEKWQEALRVYEEIDSPSAAAVRELLEELGLG